jgi:hypothetical protein
MPIRLGLTQNDARSIGSYTPIRLGLLIRLGLRCPFDWVLHKMMPIRLGLTRPFDWVCPFDWVLDAHSIGSHTKKNTGSQKRRRASVGAERREGGLCADPAYVVIPQGENKQTQVLKNALAVAATKIFQVWSRFLTLARPL